MGRLGLGELLCIFGVALLFCGAKRLPELGRSLGGAIASFKKGLADGATIPVERQP